MTTTPKLIAFAASTREQSLNRKLLALAVAQAREAGAEVTVIDYPGLVIPLYHNDPAQPFPEALAPLQAALGEAHGVMIASPEYNWSIPGGLKNLIDWLSTRRPMPLRGKRALLMCASPSVRGGILGLSQLSVTLGHLGMHVYPQWVAVGQADSQITEAGLASTKDAAFLKDCVNDFVRVVK